MDGQMVNPQEAPAEDPDIFIVRDPQVDVDALMEQVRRNVAKRRAEGAYQEDLDAIADQVRLQVLDKGAAGPLEPGSMDGAHLLAELEERWLVREAPFTSHTPVIGPLIVAVRRGWNWMSTKWYVRPLLDQQVGFNALVARALSDTVASNHALAGRLADLQARCEELEAELRSLREPGVEALQDARSDRE